ncbi:hypothetical protein J6590_061465 [Homalodisca vitripennis]|nr:hypothetical protein J6590_061465 [Homalodisca vitripennis]
MDKSSFPCCILTFDVVQNKGSPECPQHRAPFTMCWHCGVPHALHPPAEYFLSPMEKGRLLPLYSHLSLNVDNNTTVRPQPREHNTTILCNMALMSAVPHRANQTVHRCYIHTHNTITASTDCQIDTNNPSLVARHSRCPTALYRLVARALMSAASSKFVN